MKKIFNKKMMVLVMVLSLLLTAACGQNPVEQTTAAPAGTTGQTQGTTVQELKWPEKVIQITVPYNAGGDTDLYCRTAAKYLEKELGQPIVVINTAGASGMTAAQSVMDSKNDGYSILFRHTAQLITQATGIASFSYTDDMDLGGSLIQDNTYTIVVRKDSGFENLQDMVEYAKANPGQLRYSNVYGSVTHYVSVKMQEALGVELKDLDVGSSNADRVVALLGGQVDVLAANYITIQDYIESGEFVVMGILADERIPTLPDVPTFKEQGYDVVSLKVYTYAFPKGTDSAIIEKFDAAMEKVSKNEEFIKEIESFYGVVEYNNREDIYNLETQLVEDFKESLKDAM